MKASPSTHTANFWIEFNEEGIYNAFWEYECDTKFALLKSKKQAEDALSTHYIFPCGDSVLNFEIEISYEFRNADRFGPSETHVDFHFKSVMLDNRRLTLEESGRLYSEFYEEISYAVEKELALC